MSEQPAKLPQPEMPEVDRRAFLGTVSAAAGALLAARLLPLPVTAGLRVREHPRPADTVSACGDEEAWHVDDICGHRPRYAEPIPHAPTRSSPVRWEYVDPIDRMLVI